MPKRSCAARITTLGADILQQTNGHNHAVNPTTTRLDEIKSKLGKRAREEVTPVPTLYNEALVELSTAQMLLQLHLLLNSNHLCTEVDKRGSLHSLKQELRLI